MMGSVRSARAATGVCARGQKALSGIVVLSLLSMLAALAAVGARPTPTGAQDGALQTAVLAPETTLIYAAVNTDTNSDQFAQSRTLLERSGLADLFASQGEEAMPSGESMDDLQPFLGGEIGVVVTKLPSSSDLPLDAVTGTMTGALEATAVADVTEVAAEGGVVGIVLAADPDAAFTKAEELQGQAADEAGVQVETTEYEGVQISSVAGSPDGSTEGSALARLGDFVVVASAQTDLEPIIDVEAGRSPSLADSENLTRLRGELNDEFMLWAYVNGPAVKESVTANATPQDLQTLEFLLGGNLSLLDAQTGAVLWADVNGFRFDTISSLAAGASIPGMQNFDSTLDERVPADSLLFLNGMELGANPFMTAIALAVAQGVNGEEGGTIPEGADPEEYATQQFEQAAQVLGFNLKTDFVDQLSGEFVLALSVTNLLSPDGISGVFASNVGDASIVSDAVSKFAFIVASAASETTTVSTREVGDFTVNVVEDSSSGIPLVIEYGVVGDQFIVGLGNGLQTFVDGPDQSLADNPTYQAVMAELPTEHGASAYVDLAQIIAFVQFFLASSSGETSFEDASPDCANYASQEDAQAAYDADPGTLIDLDQDFDGQACEDFFGGEAAATPAPDFSAIQALGSVQFERDGMVGSSSILYIAE
jgi:hypothetical protein